MGGFGPFVDGEQELVDAQRPFVERAAGGRARLHQHPARTLGTEPLHQGAQGWLGHGLDLDAGSPDVGELRVEGRDELGVGPAVQSRVQRIEASPLGSSRRTLPVMMMASALARAKESAKAS